MKILSNSSQLIKIIADFGLIIWFLFLFVRPLDTTVGDLPRHIKNGEIIVNSLVNGELDHRIFTTNYYSYTHPDFSFINHHWLSGVLFFLVWSVTGWGGLQIIATIMALITFGLFFIVAQKKSNFWVAWTAAFFLMPLIADRRDIRPELFSYLFFSLLLWLLTKFEQTKNTQYLLGVPVIFLVWVNSHIYFIFGLAVLVIYVIDALLSKNKGGARALIVTLFFSGLAGLGNPFGLQVYGYPFKILDNYGISIQENKPLWRAPEIDPARVLTCVIALVLVWVSLLITVVIDRKRLVFKTVATAGLMSVLGVTMIRNFTLVGLFFIPLLSEGIYANARRLFEKRIKPVWLTRAYGRLLVVVVVVCTVTLSYRRLPEAWQNVGWARNSTETEAITFFKNKAISGPIFNDFGAGGYLILYGYPDIKPFVDQRPEAYPADFLKNDYSAVRFNAAQWQSVLAKYNFSTLFLVLPPISPYHAAFINDRLQDPLWVPVFKNKHHLIFVRNSPENESIIEKYALPVASISPSP